MTPYLMLPRLALVVLAATAALHAQTYTFTHLAGVRSGQGTADGTGAAAQFSAPESAAFDAAGNLFVADTSNHTIRRISPLGVVTTFAGAPGVSGTADGTGSAARFWYPRGLAIDASGNLYVSDSLNHTIRRISAAGVVVTIAGAPQQPGTSDGSGATARFRGPAGIAIDSTGTLHVADEDNHTIRRIRVLVTDGPNPIPVGQVTTFAGSAGSSGAIDATGTSARFALPSALAFGPDGDLYVADRLNHAIRRITAVGVVSTFAGAPGVPGAVNAVGTDARFSLPAGIVVDGGGNLLVADQGNHALRRITQQREVTTLAGALDEAGGRDGTGSTARFSGPRGLALSGSGVIFVTDSGNHAIRRVTGTGVVTTFAGIASGGDYVDAVGDAARFNWPFGVAVDRSGNVYVADLFSYVIRKITPGGAVSTLAGTAGVPGSANGTGTAARFAGPRGIAVDSTGNVYVADGSSHTIRKITPAGVVTTLAGSPGSAGQVDGTGAAARFDEPTGIAVDAAGFLYVTDSGGPTLRKVSPAGVVTTLAGATGQAETRDGTGTAARFARPWGVAVDDSGNVYVSDPLSRVIRRITSAGVVTTIAGAAGIVGDIDGVGTAARFNSPAGLAHDGISLYIVESNRHTIRRMAGNGSVTTIAGSIGQAGAVDGTGTAARFRAPEGIAVDAAGTLYVAESGNRAIRWGATAPPSLRGDGTATGLLRQAFNVNATFFRAVAGPFEATGLPPGLNMNAATGAITGVPTASGTFRATVRATNGAGTGSSPLVITVNAPPVITTQPRDQSVDLGATVSLRLSASGFPAPTFQWHRNGAPIPGATAASLTLTNVTAAAVLTVVVSNPFGSVTSREARITVVSGFPTFSTRPADQDLPEGGSVTLAATAAGNTPIAYQWFKDGTPIPGATTSSLALRNVTSADAGEYEVTATNAIGTATSTSATVNVAAASALSNLSIRTALGTDQILIVGAVVRDGAKNVLVRAAGPALAAFNLTGVADPRLELYIGNALVAANDDWNAALAPTFATVSAFPFTIGSRDAALQQSLNGAVTFQARATGPGTVLVEAYDASGGLGTRLANVSARSRVGTGADILIAGFNVSGASAKTVLIRAIGPGLAGFNVTGFLADPALTVVNANTGAVIATNNDWSASLAPTFARVGAFPLASSSRDAALLVTLSAGASYTVQVAGADGGTGEALVEIYEVF